MRLTTCIIVLFCKLFFSLALPNFFSDPTVKEKAPPSLLMNSVAEQPNTELFQTFNNDQLATNQFLADQSSLVIWAPTAPNGQAGYEISDASKDCSRNAGAKLRKRGSFCTQINAPKTPTQGEAGQKPTIDDPKRSNGPNSLPPFCDYPGVPHKDYQYLPDFRFGVDQN